MFPCVFIRCCPALSLGIESLVFRLSAFPVPFCSSVLLLSPVSLLSVSSLSSSLPLFLSSLSLLLPSDLFLPLPLSFCSPHLRFLSPLHFSPSSLLPRPFSLLSPCSLPAPPLSEPDRRAAEIYFAAAFLVVAFLAAGFFAVFASSFTAVLAGDFRAAGSFSTFASALTALLRVVFFFGSGAPALRA